MRVVAIRLLLEVILFAKLYLASDGSSFTSFSIYVQNRTSGFPSLNSQSVRVRAYHMGPFKHLSCHREAVVSQGYMSIMLSP